MEQGSYVLSTIYGISDYVSPDELQAAIRLAYDKHPIACGWIPDPVRHVVVKPNWVQESHEYRPDVWEPVITHPVVLEAVLSITIERMGGVGTISLCDAPHTYASFADILDRGHLVATLDHIRARWPKLRLELIDLRREIWLRREEVVVERIANELDPRDYVAFNLGRDSLFYGHLGEGRYYGADYDSSVVRGHHQGETQEYLLAGTPVVCDFFINVPKLKTHKKTGITCCLKNLVGINGDKNWLPHHTEGSPADGGDEFPDAALVNRLETGLKNAGRKLALSVPGVGNWLYRKARNAGKRVLGDSETTIRNGNWYGNDTCWRMALDLNRCLLYGNPDGTMRGAEAPKPYLGIVDGIIGGEGNGPLCPDAVPSGVLITGDNPAVLDAVSCRLMGFDPVAVPLVREAFDQGHRWPIAPCSLDEVRVWDERVQAEIDLQDVSPAVPGGFRPHFGWVGHIEAQKR